LSLPDKPPPGVCSMAINPLSPLRFVFFGSDVDISKNHLSSPGVFASLPPMGGDHVLRDPSLCISPLIFFRPEFTYKEALVEAVVSPWLRGSLLQPSL